mmetsp:Transcript_62634/g.104235  ORF Transcript_62634/g.104235 Transcript_62634/m.104235 type:complete len:223 (+) Transcript_62634:82-750(+)|eukprot:CAMPEP_0119311562 /NCGR_PEP_ID=MMETSP1333-20130426/22942_1 /TAXON_ID=418940 /ORGANISM="Scyphosphaera apsteinii, Strain RCC1455" /LENGTH=222 /DNA_ID=CAMNT_0007315973 /DNA_START=81 /DNA_END=752 /DNA_ORIENTATION=+
MNKGGAFAYEDGLIAEAVARQGGYEEVDTNNRWVALAKGLGLKKNEAKRIKERYEDMLKQTVDVEEEEEQDNDYEVEDILDIRVVDGKTEYLVKWKDYDETGEEANTWEPLSHLQGAQEILEQFEERQRKQQQLSSQAGTLDENAAVAGVKRQREESNTAESESSSPWTSISRIRRPEVPGGEPLWLVACADGTEVEVTNMQLRTKHPQLIIDFYQARIGFG